MDIHEIIRAMKTECAAKTRSGGRCRNAPIGQTGRCRMHGGKSLGGIASPRYKHGKYSRYAVARLAGEWSADVLAGIVVDQLGEQPSDLSELAAQPVDFSWVDTSRFDKLLD